MLSRFARWAVRDACPRSEAVSWMCPEEPTFVEAPTPHADRLRHVADDTVSYSEWAAIGVPTDGAASALTTRLPRLVN